MILLAQATDLTSVEAHFWKNFCLCLGVLFFVTVAAIGIYAALRKPAPTKLVDDPEINIRKAPRRYNHDDITRRFGTIETRLDGHDAEIDSAWSEMGRQKDAQMAQHLENSVSLAKIMVRLGIKEESK